MIAPRTAAVTASNAVSPLGAGMEAIGIGGALLHWRR